jgi:hypothetical protein
VVAYSRGYALCALLLFFGSFDDMVSCLFWPVNASKAIIECFVYMSIG